MSHRDDLVVWTARREAIVVLVIFLCALIYTVTFCYLHGYQRRPESLTFVFGFPDWVFWGVVAPWCVCLLLSYWFGYLFMRDADLGGTAPEDDDD